MTQPDLVTIASETLTAAINPHGAELWSLTDRAGQQWMTDADPAFWSGHAPLLFPVVGSLAGDTLRHDGQAYALPRHGFARRLDFALVAHDGATAHFRLRDSEQTRAVYPFAFVLDMAFAVEGATLAMTATVTNPGNETLPFSFGYHPAFAWPLPGSTDKHAHRLVFTKDEPGAIARVDKQSGLVLERRYATPVRGRILPLREQLFTNDAVIWTDLASRALTYGVEGGPALDVAFPDTAMLGLWQVPGANYICIEPWAGHADPQGFAGDIAEKPGIVLLAPGESRSFRMDVTVRGG
jgi:galactose mutarotase-like enzyme